MTRSPGRYRVGVDIGGTFTDFALVDDSTGRLAAHKLLTTPDDPSVAVLAGLRELLAREGAAIGEVASLVHGTTLVTNAVIERKGAATGMLVTGGFRDVLDIAMERRYDLFDLRLTFAEPVVPRALRAEVAERIRFDGTVERTLDEDAVRVSVGRLVEAHGIRALAICFLHAYANPAHERRAAALVAEAFPELQVSVSSEVVPFMREYERWSTTSVNAYVQPLAGRYLGRMERGLAAMGFAGGFLIMTASGGTVTPALARRFPVRLIESGPAAGALMAAVVGRRAGERHVLAFDMGGTTAKGALIRDGKPLKRYELEAAREHGFKPGSGLPLRVPVIDMIEIGAGGGSIASVDDSGLLAVGPRSAGARPGPACYGQGGEQATLTDANVALGHLVPENFLGGAMTLDAAAADRALRESVAAPLAIATIRAAWGVHEVINEDVARAFRAHASEIGFDYRGCAMVAFGGSGPVHALRIARKLRIPKVIFPAAAGVLSAIGLLVTPLSYETLRSGRARLAGLDAAGLEAGFAAIAGEARRHLREAGVDDARIRLRHRLDMRYLGQGYEVEVELPADAGWPSILADLPALFRERYAAIFSTSFPDQPLEIVNWKVEATGPVPDLASDYRLAPRPAAPAGPGAAPIHDDRTGGFVTAQLHERRTLTAGTRVEGPALIQEDESTCVIGAGERVTVDAQGNLVATLQPERAEAAI